MTENFWTYEFVDNSDLVSYFDEMPIWSASFGLLMLRHIEIKPYKQVLDIGTGTGFPLFELRGRLGSSSKIIGLDPWHNAINRAKLKKQHYGYYNVELIEASAEAIPLKDQSIDLIVSNLGINNFANPHKVLTECRRVLVNGGRLALTSNLNGHWDIFYKIFEAVLIELEMPKELAALQEEQAHRGSLISVTNWLLQNGFKIVNSVEDKMDMRFLNGTAFLNHHFIKLGWLSSWLAIIPKKQHAQVFSVLEQRLNAYAEEQGELCLNVPMVFIEVEKCEIE